MRAGKLRNKITIESKTITQDACGVPVESWSTYATAWASINYQGGAESVVAGRVQAEITAIFNIRYMAGIITAMRIRFGARIFSIVSVFNTNEANRETSLECKEIV